MVLGGGWAFLQNLNQWHAQVLSLWRRGGGEAVGISRSLAYSNRGVTLRIHLQMNQNRRLQVNFGRMWFAGYDVALLDLTSESVVSSAGISFQGLFVSLPFDPLWERLAKSQVSCNQHVIRSCRRYEKVWYASPCYDLFVRCYDIFEYDFDAGSISLAIILHFMLAVTEYFSSRPMLGCSR